MWQKANFSQHILKNPIDYKTKTQQKNGKVTERGKFMEKEIQITLRKKLEELANAYKVKKWSNELLCTHHPVSTIIHISPAGVPIHSPSQDISKHTSNIILHM